MKIDIHTHILPKHLPDWKTRFGYGGFITLEHHKSKSARMLRDDGKFFREVQCNCWDCGVRLKEMKRAAVDKQVLSTVPVMFSYWMENSGHAADMAKFLNDDLASSVASAPSRFIGLGTLPMQHPDIAVNELERCVKGLGMAGVQIGSHVNKMSLGDDALFPIFEAAASLGAAIFVHPWDMPGSGEPRMEEYWGQWLAGMPFETQMAITSMINSGLFERLPSLRVAFAHGGGSFAVNFGRVNHGHSARPDLCATKNIRAPNEYLGRFWVDSIVHDPRVLKYIVQLFGSNRVALGSDYPFPLGEENPGQLIESVRSFSERTREKLLWRNANEWLYGLS